MSANENAGWQDDRRDPKHPRHRELMLPCCAQGQHPSEETVSELREKLRIAKMVETALRATHRQHCGLEYCELIRVEDEHAKKSPSKIKIVPITSRVIRSDGTATMITIETRGGYGHETWSICRYGFCLNRDYEWEMDPSPSGRSDEYRERTRFGTPEEAIEFLEQGLERIGL